MKEIAGNIWDYHSKGNWIVITTNGNVKANGKAVMGRGIALQAKIRYPDLPPKLGLIIKNEGQFWVASFSEYKLFNFPTKRNWWEKSTLSLIIESAERLFVLSTFLNKEFKNIFPICLPRPGCSNGGLDWKDVKPVLEKCLDDRFIVVDKNE